MITWIDNVNSLQGILKKMSILDGNGMELGIEEGFSRWRNLTSEVGAIKRNLYFIGNGASASMASHFAADIAKNCGIRAHVFTDAALITALGNDCCFEDVFSKPLDLYMNPRDMLVAISSSGNSPNILKAVAKADHLGGNVVTLSAMAPDNPLRQSGLLNFYINGDSYGLAETGHAAILHHWMDLMAERYGLLQNQSEMKLISNF